VAMPDGDGGESGDGSGGGGGSGGEGTSEGDELGKVGEAGRGEGAKSLEVGNGVAVPGGAPVSVSPASVRDAAREASEERGACSCVIHKAAVSPIEKSPITAPLHSGLLGASHMTPHTDSQHHPALC